MDEASVSSILRINDFQEVGFEVLTAVAMKNSIFWDITLHSPLKADLSTDYTVLYPKRQKDFQEVLNHTGPISVLITCQL
jgi:hypothetical protein